MMRHTVDPETPRSQAAHHLLAGVYACFGEGFDTADLQEAQTLLVALA
jgi:hypothetical protein